MMKTMIPWLSLETKIEVLLVAAFLSCLAFHATADVTITEHELDATGSFYNINFTDGTLTCDSLNLVPWDDADHPLNWELGLMYVHRNTSSPLVFKAANNDDYFIDLELWS